MATADVVVIGAGIVGATCALMMQQEGLLVTLVDDAPPGSGVTAAGMGHLVALDETDDELDLCLLSLDLWASFMQTHPGIGEPNHCGTLWLAENEHQLQEAHARATRLSARGWRAEALTGAQIQRLEPALRPGLAGGVRVFGDSAIYPPAVAHFMATELVRRGGKLRIGKRVVGLDEGAVTLSDGMLISAKHIVVATGTETSKLLPDIPIFGRKGHLAITDRYPGRLKHQVVSMNYGQSAVTDDALAVAANVQPRSTGQWLIGSCRQDGQQDTRVDSSILRAVLQAAMDMLPCLAEMHIVRSWAGMRPASPDGRPLIGPYPGRRGIWLAVGHEGLGVTTAFASARMLTDHILGRTSQIDSGPYLPSRFSSAWSELHA